MIYNVVDDQLQYGLKWFTMDYKAINQLKSITLWLMTNYNMVYNDLQSIKINYIVVDN